MVGVRIAGATARVLAVFAQDARRPRYGYDLMVAARLPAGRLYRILARLTAAGLLDRLEEDICPGSEGQPRRSVYRLTKRGLASAQGSPMLASPRTEPAALRRHLEMDRA
jgi:PadR family transcriptional regulator PadR